MIAQPFSLDGKRVAVAGHRGLVGSALMRRLESEDCQAIGLGREVGDLRRQSIVEDWFTSEKPDLVFLAAGKVGGIAANNDHPADFLYDNLMIAANVIQAAKETGVAKLVFLGSSCIYPRDAEQPIKEEALLSGPLEKTNEAYAVAKIAGIKLCQAYRRQHGCDFVSAQPTNLYGPGDNFDLESSHVLPALLRKVHEAKLRGSKTFELWGSGKPLREFLHVDDLADALVHIAKWYSDDAPVNVGSGHEISIRALAELIAKVVGFDGTVSFDASRPDGTPRKVVDCTRLRNLGWTPSVTLVDGISSTYQWFTSSAAVQSQVAA